MENPKNTPPENEDTRVPITIVRKKEGPPIEFTVRAETFLQYRKKMKSLLLSPNETLTKKEFEKAWDDKRYKDAKVAVINRLGNNQNNENDYLHYYANCVVYEDYETSKAVNEVLRARGIDPTVVHKYILPK